ncbi:hypothetical protein H7X68_02595 [Candidatus Saccharibacteria bacterium]|nr:hypothetical protein [Candidatus Saccharibacteria bacterium]
MIGAWVGIVAGLLVVVGGIYALSTLGSRKSYDRNMFLIGGVAAIVVGLVASVGSAFWLYGTEAGARAQKSFQSSTGGGLSRVVTVYDMEGDQISQYKGKFDVDANAERIIFDVPQANGSYKRIQIWSSTGTVTIEEK